ncbi:MAG: hypothetical protein HQL46_00300 [Gammaproteobacteria bacterium]|nr:hypothetical protein [Gammaproteobacteria bacterium]
MNKTIKLIFASSLALTFNIAHSSADFFDFNSTYWQNSTANYETTNNGDGTFTQVGEAKLFSSTITAKLITTQEGEYSDNGTDKLSITFSSAGRESIAFENLGKTDAENWLDDNADKVAILLFASNLGTSLAGEDSATTEANGVIDTLIFTPTNKQGSKEKIKKDGLTVTASRSLASGALFYSKFDNDGDKGTRTGITIGYDTDISENLTVKFLLPYNQVEIDDSVNTSSQVLSPSFAFSYLVSDTDDSQVKIGANIQLTATYSETDLTDLGYLRYSSTIFGSYRYFASDNMTITTGATLGYGEYTAPGVDDPTITKIFESMGTDIVLGFGGLIEYDFDDSKGMDFQISGSHNFNSTLIDGKDYISFGPTFRYSVMDTFNLNIGYKHTEKLSSDTDYSSDTIMLNALYQF